MGDSPLASLFKTAPPTSQSVAVLETVLLYHDKIGKHI
jgi:hypothetical protein